jgi:colanic acid/amylovoran biosynthesis protein
MKKAYVRFYDQENLGDDLFLQILTDRYTNDFIINRSFSAGSFTPTNKISIFRQNKMMSYLDRVASRLMATRSALSLPIIRKQDLMVYIGGSLFMESSGLEYWERERNYFKHIKIPYYILGSNVGPVYTEKFTGILKNIFTNAEDVCFRDLVSYEMFENIPTTRVATDVVFSLDTAKYKISEEKVAVFSIIDGMKKFSPDMTSRYELEIINLAQQLATDGYKIILMSFCKYEGDEQAIGRILETMNPNLKKSVRTYYYRGDIKEALDVIAKSEILVASRFHAAILGLLFGKKVLPMAYSDKTTNILKDMDFKGPVVDINKIKNFNGSEFDFKAVKFHPVENQRLYAEMQFQELDKVLMKRNDRNV